MTGRMRPGRLETRLFIVETPSKNLLDVLADESGLAIVILDETGRELAAANNNSICAQLYTSDEFGSRCAEFCGKALEKTKDADGMIEYRCHAGLNCKAMPLKQGVRRLVAITGRTFTKAENYRQVTERAINGDFQEFPTDKFFENVLIAGSDSDFRSLTQKLERLPADEIDRLFALTAPLNEVETVAATNDDILGISRIERAPEGTISNSEQILDIGSPIGAKAIESVPDDVTEWRSLFGSFLNLRYAQACTSILEFLSKRYALPSLLWLERRGDRLETMVGIGEFSDRRVKIAISPDEPRLTAAAHDARALMLTESRTEPPAVSPRRMSLLPIMIGDEVRSVLAVEGSIDQDTIKHLTRFCRTVASQMEILRLRDEVTRRDTLSKAVQRFNENLQKIDGVDFWLHLTQVSAELLRAERASLLLQKDKSSALRPMAAIGVRADLADEPDLGGRAAKYTLERGKPLLVKDINKANIKVAPPNRNYRTPSFISYPIEIGDRGVAILNLTDKADGAAFTENDLEVLRAISPQIAVAIDRTELRAQAGAFAQLSVTDPLTGLLNRRYIETRLAEEISRSDRHSYPMSFMMLDVDDFKSYNDRFGHPAGDEALKLVGHIIRDMVRGADVAARYGGEEFAVLLPQTTADECEVIAERLRQKIEEAAFPNRPVTVSIGIASCCPTPSSSMGDLIKAADKALYRAKQKGRNNVQSFGDLETAVENVH